MRSSMTCNTCKLGVYGFPNEQAAHIALRVAREILTEDPDLSIVFCLFLQKDCDIYKRLVPIYFPPGISDGKNEEAR